MRERALAGAPEPLGFLAVAALQLVAEPLVVLLGHAEQIGDDVERERTGEVADELALAPLDELVDLAVGVAPHEVFVLAQPLGRDEPHQQAPVRLVPGVVHDRDLVAERQLVTVLVDQLADVVALERHRKAGEGPADGVAGRERSGVRVHRDGLVVAGHHDHAVVRLPLDGALLAEMVEVGVGVLDQVLSPEEIDVVELPHQRSFTRSLAGRRAR